LLSSTHDGHHEQKKTLLTISLSLSFFLSFSLYISFSLKQFLKTSPFISDVAAAVKAPMPSPLFLPSLHYTHHFLLKHSPLPFLWHTTYLPSYFIFHWARSLSVAHKGGYRATSAFSVFTAPHTHTHKKSNEQKRNPWFGLLVWYYISVQTFDNFIIIRLTSKKLPTVDQLQL